MKRFEHVDATSTTGAIRLLGADGHARPIAGGTDLLTELKLGIISPDRLVNLKTIPGLGEIHFDKVRGLQLGAMATLDSIAAHDVVRERYPVLWQAILSAASPQLRNVGTIGGNLCQDSRCWYYRGPFYCWLKGGEICYARDGENAHHAIFGGGLCYMVHPSDLAPALIALGASVRITGPNGGRVVPVEQFFQRPREGARGLTILGQAEIITEVRIPASALGSQGTYLKAMDRRAWAFALASVAVQLTMDGDTVQDVRLVLGGVAPTPWRVPVAEDALRGQPLDNAAIDRVAEAAAAGAQPLGHNYYKVPLVKGIVRQALTALRAHSAT